MRRGCFTRARGSFRRSKHGLRSGDVRVTGTDKRHAESTSFAQIVTACDLDHANRTPDRARRLPAAQWSRTRQNGWPAGSR